MWEKFSSDRLTKKGGWWSAKDPGQFKVFANYESMTNNNEPKLIAQWVHPESSYSPPEGDCESVCIHCQINALQEGQENLSAEVYELSQKIGFLIKMLGGK